MRRTRTTPRPSPPREPEGGSRAAADRIPPSPAQLRLTAWKRDEHDAFCQTFAGSLLWAAERNDGFYQTARIRAALRAEGGEGES